MMRRFLSAFVVLVALAGCAESRTPQGDLIAIKAGFAAAFTAAKAYVELPACAPGGSPLCSDIDGVNKIGAAAAVAYLQINAAEQVILAVNNSASDVQKALTAAQVALAALQGTIAALNSGGRS